MRHNETRNKMHRYERDKDATNGAPGHTTNGARGRYERSKRNCPDHHVPSRPHVTLGEPSSAERNQVYPKPKGTAMVIAQMPIRMFCAAAGASRVQYFVQWFVYLKDLGNEMGKLDLQRT